VRVRAREKIGVLLWANGFTHPSEDVWCGEHEQKGSNRCIYFGVNTTIMSTCVYSIRLDDCVRHMMEEMSDVNWQAEIRQAVERMVREKKKHRFLAEAEELRKKMKPVDISAAEMIREDRDAR
jgi:hypothetical protein